MHKLYRTPKERLARPLWALNNPIDFFDGWIVNDKPMAEEIIRFLIR